MQSRTRENRYRKQVYWRGYEGLAILGRYSVSPCGYTAEVNEVLFASTYDCIVKIYMMNTFVYYQIRNIVKDWERFILSLF